MIHKTIYINTTDEDLIKEFETCNLQGVEVLERMFCSARYHEVVQFIINLSSDVAVGVFASWLYDKIKNRDTQKTTINSKQIINNKADIIILINNQPQDKEN